MELSATKTAQFLVQNEYHSVLLDAEQIVLSSHRNKEEISFNDWNGQVLVKQGLLWSDLHFYAHAADGQSVVWVVQGLPKRDCKYFARQAVECYQKWHDQQSAQLEQFHPVWEQELNRLRTLPAFLSHGKISNWAQQVQDGIDQIGFSHTDLWRQLPDKEQIFRPWLESTNQMLESRNRDWMEQERQNWEVLFAQLESSPLNVSQQEAVLLNDDNNLVLAGAGSGKTAVLSARVAYLLQSHLAKPEDILLVSYGRKAAEEMRQRLDDKVGLAAQGVQVKTFHQLGLSIINDGNPSDVTLSPMATDDKLRQAWCINWLKKHWMTPTNFNRWKKHLAKWPIAYIAGDDELGSHVENEKLIAWLDKQLMQLSALTCSKKHIQQALVEHDQYARLNSELSLVWPCYQAWKTEFKESGHIDFNMMIAQAADLVNKGSYKSSWKFIMIDEYQDISPQRLNLVQSLCDQVNKVDECVLFAVGDDWQSIYQFSGSDIELTTDFEQRFTHTSRHYLDTTYRFNSKIGEVANAFVQENPNQITKPLVSYKQQKQKAVYLAPSANVEKILEQISRQANQDKSVLLLGRNHYHKPELFSDWEKQYPMLQLQFMTCHASKGREADFVIVLSVDEGQFPAKVKTLHLDTALTQTKDDFPYAEERRLFYVALTRAKEKVWVTYSGSGSCFVKELIDGDYPVVKQK
ncbi:DNA helicase IV [Vibrio profundum]|uniref:DNA helicase IV n=1 Tax=Vibrio profundum TaxID=2910247 RepID=UPI003D0FAA70